MISKIMDTISRFLIILLSSGIVAAIVSGVLTAIMQKRNEKESRLFNSKLEAYKEFATHLESRFVTLTNGGRSPDLTTLMEISAKCLLVSGKELNFKLKTLFSFTDVLNKKCYSPDFNLEKEKPQFIELWNKVEEIENLMREDLGFK